MGYSDAVNAKGRMETSVQQVLSGVSDEYLKECIEKLKNADSFSIFGGGRQG